MTIRVCMLVNNLDVGGLEKVVLSLLRHLPADQVEASLACLSGPGRLFDEVALPPERRLVLHRPPRLGVAGKLGAPAQMIRIARFLRELDVDVLHAHNLAPLVFGGVPARLLGRRRPAVVYSEHNQIYSASARTRGRFRAYVRLADEVVAVSRDLRRTLVDELRVAPPVRVLHNGIDASAFTAADGAPCRRELDVREGEFLVGTAVVLSEQKGIRYLLEAARRVRAADPSIRFVIAGDGPLRADLEAAAAALDLGRTVRFLGYRRDVPALVAALDAYVLPSLWEGLPLALLEALASGVPIVATAVGGNPEIVEHGTNGFLVPPRDPSALADAVLALRRDAGLRQRIRRENVAKFVRGFSVESMVRNHVELYRELLGRRARARA